MKTKPCITVSYIPETKSVTISAGNDMLTIDEKLVSSLRGILRQYELTEYREDHEIQKVQFVPTQPTERDATIKHLEDMRKLVFRLLDGEVVNVNQESK